MGAAKIGADCSGGHGDFTMYIDNVGAIHESPLRILRSRSFFALVPLRNPRDTVEEEFRPPDFGGAHPSDPRLHLKICAYY
jgi:hypothetical protein